MGRNKSNMNNKVDNIDKKEKKKGDIRGVILFFVFFVIGVAVAIFGTTHFLESKEKETEQGVPAVEQIEITSKSEYQDIINELYERVKGSSEYYTSKGVSVDTMDNNFKYGLLYENIVSKSKYVEEKMVPSYFGAAECSGYFILDVNDTTGCSVYKISKENMNNSYKELFNLNELDTSISFYPSSTRLCVPIDSYYYCGNIYSISNVTGNLDTRFSVTKVIKDAAGYIYIYDKGYLIDNRSTVIKVDGITNYYLHSSDSTEYYYELKSADNLTFKHTFKLGDNEEYHYVSSEVEEQ